ncbi:hypothetical protein RDI58_013353 [Solanum bulbocastanum]|uniref:Uncharacterized protein n=1 Tax=Solanum bulbocastanum TaxID=147425 RepID=A0AAN8YHN0_SOLBU
MLPGETQDFQDYIDMLKLTALKAIGYHYTFCNKQQVDYLGAGIFDHSPILIQVCPPLYSNPMPFRYKGANVAFIIEAPCLTYEQKCRLVVPVTKEEIMLDIKSMPTDMSPGINGFPIEFL